MSTEADDQRDGVALPPLSAGQNGSPRPSALPPIVKDSDTPAKLEPSALPGGFEHSGISRDSPEQERPAHKAVVADSPRDAVPAPRAAPALSEATKRSNAGKAPADTESDDGTKATGAGVREVSPAALPPISPARTDDGSRASKIPPLPRPAPPPQLADSQKSADLTSSGRPPVTTDSVRASSSLRGKFRYFTILALVYNAILLLVGITGIGVGVYLNRFGEDIGLGLTDIPLPIALLCFGSYMVASSFVGFYVTMTEKKYPLLAYVVLLACLCIAIIIVTSIAFDYDIHRDQHLGDAWRDSPAPPINDIQTKFDCCGYLNPYDKPGDSCTEPIDPSTSGCQPAILAKVGKRLHLFCVAGLTAGLFTLVGIGLYAPVLHYHMHSYS